MYLFLFMSVLASAASVTPTQPMPDLTESTCETTSSVAASALIEDEENGLELIQFRSFSTTGGNKVQEDLQIIAFDCGVLQGPPNTLLTARRALRTGATALNVDLALTHDNKLVAVHSSSHWLHLKGLPPIGHDVSLLNFDELPTTPPCSTFRKYWRSIKVPEDDLVDLEDCEPQRLSTAEEFLEAFPEVPLHFDLKADTLERQALQAQLLASLLHDRFPQRIRRRNGDFTSVRFFKDPRRMHEQDVLSFVQQVSTNISVAVFLGDPADELGWPNETASDLSKVKEDAGLLGVLAKGPEAAPAGTRGVYLPPSVMAQGWTVPSKWGRALFVICDVAAEGLKALTLDERRLQIETCASSGSGAIHTAFFRGLPQRSNFNTHSLDTPTSDRPKTNAFLGIRPISSHLSWGMAFRGWPSRVAGLPKMFGPTWEGSSWTRCATKHVTAMLVIRLLELGKIPGLDTPVINLLQLSSSQLPLGKQRALRKLTLREVMSGVALLQPSNEKSPWEDQPGMSAAELSGKALASVDPVDISFKNNFTYSNQQWVVVERAIEVATSLKLPAAAKKYLFDEVGLSSGTYYADDAAKPCPIYLGEVQRQRNLRAAIGLCSTPDDLLLLTRMLVEEPGKRLAGVSPVTNRKVLSPSGVKELLIDQLAQHFPQAVDAALKTFPIPIIGAEGYPVVGRSLGAFVLTGGVIMAHGGDDILVGAKMILRFENGQSRGPVMVQMAQPPLYSGRNDFAAHVPADLRKVAACYSLYYGASTEWYLQAVIDSDWEAFCQRYNS